MDIACIRPFTVYGPRQRINMAIPLFVQLINEGKSITVHGMDTFRDFTYINDVVSGIMNILGIYHGYQIYNLGSGKPVKLKELIAHIEQRLSKKAIISYSSLMSGEATNTLADITKARDAFDYDPQFSIEQGLDLYISWYLKESGRAL